MINPKIQSLLNDLYMIDPSLKKHEPELSKLVEEFMKSKPTVELNEDFIHELRQKLNLQAQHLTSENSKSLFFNPFNTMFKRLFLPFAGGVLATALVIVVLQNLSSFSTPTEENEPSLISMTPTITKVQPNAFGALASSTAVGISANAKFAPGSNASTATVAPEKAMNLSSDTSTRSQSGGGGAVSIATPATPPMAMTGGSAVDQKMANTMIYDPNYIPTTYKYIYKGEPVTLTSTTVDVFKRINQKANGATFSGLVKNFGFGLMDLTGFQGLRAQNITLIQDEKLGYALNLNFDDSSINLYQNWEKWDYPTSNCGEDQNCYEQNRLKPSDIPSDESLKAISDAFLKEHGIDASRYGTPVIQNFWQRDWTLLRAQGRPDSEFYVPDTINVVYPLLIDGKTASDQSGTAMGMYVGVNIYHKKVASVNNLRVDQFQSSAYDAITDWSVIEKYLAEGGTPYPNVFAEGQQVKEVQVELGQPETILMETWQYKDNLSNELFTPALRFPIIKPEGDQTIYQDFVVVPLAKELLQTYDYGRPMPMMKEVNDAVVNPPQTDKAPDQITPVETKK